MADAESMVERGMRSARQLAVWVRERFGEELLQARVFGSVARGEATEGSDVDVFLLFNRRLTYDEKREIAGAAFEIDMDNDTWTGWIAETPERWDNQAVVGAAMIRAVEEDGVSV
ncbi:MAG: nucleotidyltransferase domain-containing protein [Armatimonadota bacterium]